MTHKYLVNLQLLRKEKRKHNNSQVFGYFKTPMEREKET